MVSVMPAFGPEMYYPSHVPRLSTSKSLHMRSSSMPEAVYIATQQAAAAVAQQQQRSRVRHPSGQQTAGLPPPPVIVSLRRSHTNVADFGAVKRSAGHFASRVQPRYFAADHHQSKDHLPVLYTARSRSNIAALGLNHPEVVYRPLPNQHGGGHSKISRASSFYHHRPEAGLASARSLGYLASAVSQSRSSLALQPPPPQPQIVPQQSQSCKDLSQPLHVDCSVEYDLGNQPKIPKDSAPLLIIHPAYQQKKQLQQQQEQQLNARFHPYTHSSIPSSPYSETAKSSGHGTASSSLSSTSSTSYPHSSIISRPQAVPQRVARHSSFLVTSPPKMAANPPGMGFATPINKRSSFAGGEARSLFHLSMPDIAANNKEEKTAPSGSKTSTSGPAAPRQWTHNRKAQHRHFKAKMNLNPKLEAVRKHSSDSATSSSGGGGCSGPSVDDNTVITTQGSSGGPNPTSRPSNCDSGLGTPVSLLDEMAVSAISSSLGGSTGHNSSSQGSGHLSKWRSSMSGLVTGFFCCSAGAPSSLSSQGSAAGDNQASEFEAVTIMTPATPVRNPPPQVARFRKQSSAGDRATSGMGPLATGGGITSAVTATTASVNNNNANSSIVICAPSSPILHPPSSQQNQQHQRITTSGGCNNPGSGSDWLMSSRRSATPTENSFWEDTKQAITSSPVHRRGVGGTGGGGGWNSPHLTSTTSSSTVSSSGIQQQQHQQQPQSRRHLPLLQVCRFCQSTNPGADCHDGFCSSIWNKENLMRPIHI